MKCYSCDKAICIEVYGRCREIHKYELVKLILEVDPVYLSKSNHNKCVDLKPLRVVISAMTYIKNTRKYIALER